MRSRDSDLGELAPPLDTPVTAKEELSAVQLESIARLIPGHRVSFAIRAAIRFQDNFLNKPWRDKLNFVRFTSKWAANRVRTNLRSRLVPKVKRPAGSPLAIGIYGTGSVGDYISHATFIEAFYRTFGPDIYIDFFCRKPAGGAFAMFNAPFVRNVLGYTYLPHVRPSYDLVITLQHLVRYDIVEYERVCENPKLANAIVTAAERWEKYRMYYDNHPMLDGLFAKLMSLESRNRADTLGYFGNIKLDRATHLYLTPDEKQYDVLQKFGLERDYITIHDGFDEEFKAMASRATKCWPVAHWEEFLRLFKAEFPDVLVVQLGAAKSGKIAGADVNLVNKTNLHEAAWVLKHSKLHVDGESGLVRIAKALSAKSLVLFGPTNANFFGLGGNINLVAQVCNDCWWTKQDWMSFCVRGLEEPECMMSLTPTLVMEHVRTHFAEMERATCAVVHSAISDGVADSENWESTFVAAALHQYQPAKVANLGEDVLEKGDNFNLSSTYWVNGSRHGSLHNVPAEDGTYDAVVLPLRAEVVAKKYALKEALRIAKPGGVVVTTFDFTADDAWLDDALTFVGVGERPFTEEQMPTRNGAIRAAALVLRKVTNDSR